MKNTVKQCMRVTILMAACAFLSNALAQANAAQFICPSNSNLDWSGVGYSHTKEVTINGQVYQMRRACDNLEYKPSGFKGASVFPNSNNNLVCEYGDAGCAGAWLTLDNGKQAKQSGNNWSYGAEGMCASGNYCCESTNTSDCKVTIP